MLKLCDVNDSGQSVWLVAPGVTVGRDQGCDLCLPDDSIAKLHLKIAIKGDQLTLGNVSGGSQVLVNGKSVASACHLKLNDRITIGSRTLQIVDPKVTKLSSSKAKNVAWALRANHKAIAGKVFPVKGGAVVGRSEECDITFSLSHLSRRHARMEVREGLLFVIDLGSANGTFVNGRRITESRVRRGDELRFDSLSFSVVGPADDLDRTAVRPAISSHLMKSSRLASGEIAAEDVTQRSFAVPIGEQREEAPNMVESLEGEPKPSISMKAMGLAVLLIAGAAGYFWLNTLGVF
ncbi:FHA domain-containing protein [Microbulbifer sp. THAF38]|uniref:FHA domain-containing protein n=1 Tax=unclassified Microbulbifer TaxID=2619833 RepID=UPI00126904DA|nr:FHA domain-containing protein [Microbulbifer sp. THAF38]QFT54629.1 Oxoglutarate dehydrogenase inhibitor [Microbulbifer sp. THAF38]